MAIKSPQIANKLSEAVNSAACLTLCAAFALAACAHSPATNTKLPAAGYIESSAQIETAWAAAMDAYQKGDYRTEIALLRPLADQGYPQAQGMLAIAYGLGEGVKQDFAEDERWSRKAAEQGDADGEWLLGMLYETGHGVPEDYIQACAWFTLSADQGDKRGIEERDSLVSRMSLDQLADAESLLRRWKSQKN